MSELQPWMVESKFDQEKGYTNFSNDTMEAYWDGRFKVPFREKVFKLIVRHAWGWDWPFAVKWRDRKTGAFEPYRQTDICDDLKAEPDRVSKACARLLREGRLLPDTGEMLYPSGNPVPLPEAENPPAQDQGELPNLATLKRTILRFINNFPFEAVAKNGNLEKVRETVQKYSSRRDQGKADYDRTRKEAEAEMVRDLCELAGIVAKNGKGGISPKNGKESRSTDAKNGNPGAAHQLITTSSLQPTSRAATAASPPSVVHQKPAAPEQAPPPPEPPTTAVTGPALADEWKPVCDLIKSMDLTVSDALTARLIADCRNARLGLTAPTLLEIIKGWPLRAATSAYAVLSTQIPRMLGDRESFDRWQKNRGQPLRFDQPKTDERFEKALEIHRQRKAAGDGHR